MPGPTVAFRRGQRRWKAPPTDPVLLPKYPQEPSSPTPMSRWLVFAPVAGIVAMSFGFGLLYNNLLYPIIISSASMVYPAIMLLRQRDQAKRWRTERDRLRDAYARRVEQVERELEDRRRQQIEYLRWTHPDVDALIEWAAERSERLWERRPDDPDFLELRLGMGQARASFEVKIPRAEIPELAPPQQLQAQTMAEEFLEVKDVPATVNLAATGSMAICGPQQLREAVARSVLTSLVGLHAPSDLEVYAILPARNAAEWSWLKWLPHCQAMAERDGQIRLAYEASSIRQLLAGLLDELQARSIKPGGGASASQTRRQLVLLIGDYGAVRGDVAVQRIMQEGRELKASLLMLIGNPRDVPDGCGTRLELVNERQAALFQHDAPGSRSILPEPISPQVAERFSRSLAPLEPMDARAGGDLPGEIRLLELMGTSDLETLDLEARWMNSLGRPPSLQQAIGVRQGDRPLVLDLKQSGHGPHGLIAGTTGSGKSELLLTLLAALAIDHHPHQVNFVLVDYKGGTAMSVLENLPHTVGVVTDLDGKQTRRALVALRSEMTRREEILARHQVADIEKYHELGIAEPFPYLFIVIDEFAELKERFKYDLAEVLNEFVSVAQKGRALGVHLVLAMQKPEGVVNDAIRANMRYRICLRVERMEDSRNVLGRPDAYLLPNRPAGRAYLQVGNNEQFDLFQVARIAGFHRPDGAIAPSVEAILVYEVLPDGRRVSAFEVASAAAAEPQEPSQVRTEAQIVVARAAATAERMKLKRLRSPWPPPLPEAIGLDSLLDLSAEVSFDGERWPDEGAGLRAAPIGLLDDPIHQRQLPLRYEPTQDAHLLIVGAPGSGRTTALLSLVASIASSHPPDEVHLHLVDYAGHLLETAFAELPHLSGTYNPAEQARIRRLLSTLESELERRKGLFADAGAANLVGYRRASEQQLAAVITVINNFYGFREDFIDEMGPWTRLMREGGAYGLYFVLTSDRLPPSIMADLIQTRIALRLADRTMYSLILNGRPELTTYEPLPGRGFVSSTPPLEVQIAVPAIGTSEVQVRELQKLSRSMNQAWEGPRPEPVRVLPQHVPMREMLTAGREGGSGRIGGQIGLESRSLEPATVDLERVGSYFLVAGPPECGRTTALASLAIGLAWNLQPSEFTLTLITPNRAERRPLDPLARLPHCLGQAKTPGSVKDLVELLESRLLSPQASGGDPRASAAHHLILIDDYHLLAERLDREVLERLAALARSGEDSGVSTALALPSTVLGSLTDNLIRQARGWRTGLWLRSTDGTEASLVGLRLPAELRGVRLPPGRGLLYDPSEQLLIQVASTEATDPEGEDGKPGSPGLDSLVTEIVSRRPPA